jgi:hypothetical protein
MGKREIEAPIAGGAARGDETTASPLSHHSSLQAAVSLKTRLPGKIDCETAMFAGRLKNICGSTGLPACAGAG